MRPGTGRTPADTCPPCRGTEARAGLRHTVEHPHACSPRTRRTVLRRVPLFAGLDDDAILAIDARTATHTSPVDATLCRAGESAEMLSVLAAGRAKSFTTTADGHEVIDALLAPGDLFGGLPVLGHRSHPTTVRTLTDVCMLQIDARAFRELLADLPALALRVIDDLSARLDGAREVTALLASASVLSRVAATLDALCEKFGSPSDAAPGAIELSLPLSRADLAGLTGSTVESVSRAMSTLRGAGIVESGRRWTTVLDRERLRDLAAEEGVGPS